MNFTKKIFFLLLIYNCVLSANTYLNGYYQLKQTTTKTNSHHKWAFDNPDHYLLLKLYSNDIKNTDLYFEGAAGGSSPTTEFWFQKGHISFKLEGKNKGIETLLFSGEDRTYISDHILNFSYGNSDIEGIYCNYWLPNNSYGKIILGNYKSEVNNDLTIFTFNQHFFDYKLKYNISYGEKRWGDNNNDYNSVYGIYLEFLLFNETRLYSEILKGWDHSQSTNNKNIAFKTELRWLKLYSDSFGELGYRISYSKYDINYKNYIGESKSDEILFSNEMYYNLPKKAITLRFKDDYKENANGQKTDNTLYSEIYIEFLHGYKFKSYYNYYINANHESYPSIFFQLENDLQNIYLKYQYKIKNLNTDYQNDIYGVESILNLTKKVIWTNRVLIAYPKNLNTSRKSFFSQIQYDLEWDGEFYIQYGAGWYGDNDLCEDNDFVDNSSATNEERVECKISINF